MLLIYACVLVLLTLYSYALVDPNFTLINHPFWEIFRNLMVQLGYYQREWSFIFYFVLIALLFFFNWYLIRKRYPPLKIAIITAGLLLFSYPFLSHDFFNYLFDAKILTIYRQNPYLHKALDFPNDPWLRFMHWTHRTYPYGPGFLLLSLFPSWLSFGKLLLAFIFFKTMFAGFYLLAVWVLNKFNKTAALFFASSPLVIIEGLVNSHNDLIGVSLALTALYFLYRTKNKILATVFGLMSIGIKYVTVIYLVLIKKNKLTVYLSSILFLGLLWYLYTKVGIHPWYLLNLLVLLIFIRSYLLSFSILSLGLLLSYYPYIVLGGWDQSWKVVMKEQIIMLSLIVFLVLATKEIITCNKNSK